MIDELKTERQKKFYNYLKKEVLNKGASIKEHIDALADSGLGMDPDDVAMMREVGNLLQHHLDLKAIVVKVGDGLTAEPKPIWADGEGERCNLLRSHCENSILMTRIFKRLTMLRLQFLMKDLNHQIRRNLSLDAASSSGTFNLEKQQILYHLFRRQQTPGIALYLFLLELQTT